MQVWAPSCSCRGFLCSAASKSLSCAFCRPPRVAGGSGASTCTVVPVSARCVRAVALAAAMCGGSKLDFPCHAVLCSRPSRPHFLRSVVYDVYMSTRGDVRLVDVAPIVDTTSPLLFTWPELGLAPLPTGLPRHDGGDEGAGGDPGADDRGSGDGAAASGADGGAAGGSGVAGGEETRGGGQGQGGTGVPEVLGVPSSAESLPLRLVGEGEGLQLGMAGAVAMPYDMLMLQDLDLGTVEGAVGHMRRQQQG